MTSHKSTASLDTAARGSNCLLLTRKLDCQNGGPSQWSAGNAVTLSCRWFSSKPERITVVVTLFIRATGPVNGKAERMSFFLASQGYL